MAIQIKLALLRDRLARDGLAAELDEIAEDAASAVEDLRAVAHGIYPTVLRERGLGDAIRAFGRTCSVPLEVAEALDGRCAPVVELALYGCATDAIRNAFQHGGAGVRLTVSLVRSGGDVALEVTDDGAGFDPTAESSGGGLVAMRDRMGAVGGDIEIVSAPGHGTTVRCRAAASGPATTDG